MDYQRTSYNSIWTRSHEFHVLTYAEEGFAPLNQHTKEAGLSKEQLVDFAARINERNEPGSLHPLAALSAVPRSLIRDQQNVAALSQSIEEFYRNNSNIIGARRVLFDFRSPNVERYVLRAIEMSFRSPDAEFITELLVVDDSAP